MSIMLPSQNSAQLSLADVLPSCLASLNVDGFINSLELPLVNSAVVVMIDGLGQHNLESAGAHARFLMASAQSSPSLSTVFPSTTAAALASFTTGVAPGVHGMTGYTTRDPESGTVINLLTGLGTLSDTASWMPVAPLYRVAAESGIAPTVVAHPRFSDTALTTVIHKDAEYVGAKSLDERIAETLRVVSKPGKHLVVLYISELDELAHNKGVNSPDWASALEGVDGAIKQLVHDIPANTGVLVTADHGVIDIPASRHYLYGLDQQHMEHIAAVAGEPRCIQLYFSDNASAEQRQSTLTAWSDDWSELAWVLTREEVITQGLYGDVSPAHLPRLGDIFVLAKKDVAFYDERDTALKGRSMIGQHGGVSATELTIPGIRLGAYASH